MQTHFYTIDWIVLCGYFVGVMSLGLLFSARGRSSEQFTVGGRSLPAWLCGLSIFATYLSSISYLALPGKSFSGNWNPFVFSLAIPLATFIAVKWFLPYYRASDEVSAYALLERRFGAWARIYASAFYLLFQIARMGVVMYLMALPMAVIFGWNIITVILLTGVAVTVYSFIGGIVAVIWSDAIQAIVLMGGAVVATVVMLAGLPGGAGEVLTIATENNKFSLGSWDPTIFSSPTVWVVLAYGFFENLKNFGIDQSYVQRYLAAGSDQQARRSLWLGGLLYVPVSALFFFIGTSLFAFYTAHPEDMQELRLAAARQQLVQEGFAAPAQDAEPDAAADYDARLQATAAEVSEAKLGDRAFPLFIAKHLPPGVTGLLIAAVFAAAMSTVSTSLNSSATLVMTDFYQRFVHPNASEQARMLVLRGATVLWGAMGVGMALALVSLTESALDLWWTLSSVLSGGIVGLFLLGQISRRADNAAGALAVAVGLLVIAWMVFSNTSWWPAGYEHLRSPFHSFMVTVVGTLTILLTGLLVSGVRAAKQPPS
ncbi:Sodium/glucose cotransporter [Posidoniimonas polymericola]|uniref:Sodium/glucose cotransporter n=1 Tax=Posidoniimonas polymericola TaxID=2528002 RepID=A0A5C5YL12_9BACT|nr:sodium:solute symporter [Posidoniimonas polymericola]TWT75541.1 Sodium/glucose cotransporter [Posidoniimonas polymericola]